LDAPPAVFRDCTGIAETVIGDEGLDFDPDFDSDLDDEAEGEVRLPWRLILSGVLAAVLGAMPCWVSAIYRQSVARGSWHV
jgi:hypothetical protein